MTRLGVGLCSVTFRALPYEDVLAHAGDAAIEAIEWAGDSHVPLGDLARARSVGAATRARGIAVASYGSYIEAGVASSDAFASALETAVALGAPNVRVWAGRRGVPSAAVSAEERDRVAAALREFTDRAASGGVTVSLEYHRETLTDGLASTLDLLQRVDRRNLFTYWQPRPGLDSREAAAELRALRPWLSHLHVFHWDRHRARFALADAASFWTPLLEAAASFDDARLPRRWAMLEFVRGDDPLLFSEDARALHRWLAAPALASISPPKGSPS
jgi:sugar phosphate isomerase/epimerase